MMRGAALAVSVSFTNLCCGVCGVDGVVVVIRSIRRRMHCVGGVCGYVVNMLIVWHAAAVGVWALMRQTILVVVPKLGFVKRGFVLDDICRSPA